MRGESGRVAARVRRLLNEHEHEHERGRPVAGAPPATSGSSGDRGAVTWWRRLAARLVSRVPVQVPVRVDPGRRAALAVAGAVALAAVLTGAWLVAERPRALAVSATPTPIVGASSPGGTGARRSPSAPPASAAPEAPGASPGGSAEMVVVDVAGKVRHPGVYRLPAGSRVENALAAAGGPLAGVRLDSLNLAAKVVDGQQISVGVPPAAGGAAGGPAGSAGGGAGGGSGGGGGSSGGPVDLNTATLEQLETLPGVGPVLGQHILDWRSAHGRFATVDQLNDVPGIGEVKFGALRDLVSV